MMLVRMVADDVNEVLAIETTVFPHPWSRANFLDSLVSGYDAWVLRDDENTMAGYVVVMMGVDEAHLLNIAVRRDGQGQGAGRCLMAQALTIARTKQALQMLLEVRPSNTHAVAVYRHYGFSEIGRRKNYYPAANNAREDALMMSLPL
jgi:ribosomal-protein-alanine N-acetyltransferase